MSQSSIVNQSSVVKNTFVSSKEKQCVDCICQNTEHRQRSLPTHNSQNSKIKITFTITKMKSFFASAFTILLAVSQVAAFSTSSSFSGSSVSASAQNSNGGLTMEYIPAGMSKEQWKKVKEQDKKSKGKKNLGAGGITTFKSRSFSDWQKAGGKNLFPGKCSTVAFQPLINPYFDNTTARGDKLSPLTTAIRCESNRTSKIVLSNIHILSNKSFY